MAGIMCSCGVGFIPWNGDSGSSPGIIHTIWPVGRMFLIKAPAFGVSFALDVDVKAIGAGKGLVAGWATPMRHGNDAKCEESFARISE